MDIINVDWGNIADEHICCAITDKKGESCAASKKSWLIDRFEDGLVFKKLNVRGKVFIEYIPAEKAWMPIQADNYMFINCFWVSGQYKGKGYSNQLLEQCIADAKAKDKFGLTVVSSAKKMPFLSDPGHLKHKQFRVADTANPFYQLLYLPFRENAPLPQFKEYAKTGQISENGLVLFYSNQCPHTEKYALITKALAEQRGADFKLIKYETAEQAQNAPIPSTTYSLFYNRKFITNEILTEKKFNKFLDDNGL